MKARVVGIAAVMLVALDVFTTLWLLAQPGMHEGNPLAIGFFRVAGYQASLVGRTTMIVVATFAAIWLIDRGVRVTRRVTRLAWFGLTVSTVCGLGASVNNLIILKG